MVNLVIGPLSKRPLRLEAAEVVTLLDGSRKKAADLAVGDVVLGWGKVMQIAEAA